MSITENFLVNTKNFESIIKELRSVDTLPGKLTNSFLERLGYSNPSDLLVLHLFKDLKMLEQDGTPTPLFEKFRKDETTDQAMAEGITNAYTELFKSGKAVYNMQQDELKEEFKKHFGDSKSDLILKYMANTFLTLVNYAGLKTMEEIVSQKADEFSQDNDNGSSVNQVSEHQNNGSAKPPVQKSDSDDEIAVVEAGDDIKKEEKGKAGIEDFFPQKKEKEQEDQEKSGESAEQEPEETPLRSKSDESGDTNAGEEKNERSDSESDDGGDSDSIVESKTDAEPEADSEPESEPQIRSDSISDLEAQLKSELESTSESKKEDEESDRKADDTVRRQIEERKRQIEEQQNQQKNLKKEEMEQQAQSGPDSSEDAAGSNAHSSLNGKHDEVSEADDPFGFESDDEEIEDIENESAEEVPSKSKGDTDKVKKAIIKKAELLYKLGKYEEALPAYKTVVDRYSDSDDDYYQEQVSKAVIRRASIYGKLERYDEALPAYDDVIDRFEDADKKEFYEYASEALIKKIEIMEMLELTDQLLPLYAKLVKRLGNTDDPRFIDHVDKAYVKVAQMKLDSGEPEKALKAINGAIKRFENSDRENEFLEQAMYQKAELLEQLNRDEEALEAYERFLSKFGSDSDS